VPFEIMWENTVKPDRPHTTIWRMRVACWIPKPTNPHSEYVIIIAFPRQKWLCERAWTLGLYVHCRSGSCSGLFEQKEMTDFFSEFHWLLCNTLPICVRAYALLFDIRVFFIRCALVLNLYASKACHNIHHFLIYAPSIWFNTLWLAALY